MLVRLSFVKLGFVNSSGTSLAKNLPQEIVVTDEDLMLAYADDNAQAFDKLYTRYRDRVYRFFLRQTNNDEQTAAELHQDVWLRVIRSRETYQVTALFKTWLFCIVHNRLTDHYRSAGKRQEWHLVEDETELPDSQPLPAEASHNQEINLRFKTLANRLARAATRGLFVERRGRVEFAADCRCVWHRA